MSEIPATQNSELQSNYLAIPDHTGKRVLMLHNEGRWSLPCFQTAEFLPDHKIGYINRVMRQQLGIDVTVLRHLYVAPRQEDKKRPDIIYAMENHSPQWTPGENTLWVDRDTLADLLLAIPDHQAIIEPWLAEAESGEIPAQRAPWAVNGWYEQATGWITNQLAALGTPALGPIEQVRQWSISSIMRVRTESGDIYFKAVPTLFAREPAVTRALSARYPDHVPTPLAIAAFPDQGWMLLHDFGAKLADNTNIADTESAARALARIQVESTGDIDELLAAGCVDRRLDKLPSQLDALLDDPSTLSGLESAEIDRLLAFAPRLKAMCEQLAGYAVPQTLVHGDYHANNIAVSDGNILIFDWTDVCVAHPFLDLPVLLEYDTPEGVPDARIRLRDAYLQAWTAYEPMERLVEAFALAEPLGALHQAISYQSIVASIEAAQKWQLNSGTAEWLRVLLRYTNVT